MADGGPSDRPDPAGRHDGAPGPGGGCPTIDLTAYRLPLLAVACPVRRKGPGVHCQWPSEHKAKAIMRLQRAAFSGPCRAHRGRGKPGTPARGQRR